MKIKKYMYIKERRFSLLLSASHRVHALISFCYIARKQSGFSILFLSSSKSSCKQADCFHFQAVLQSAVFFYFVVAAVENIYTYHSLKFEARVEVVVWWTVEEAEGDMELLPWFSVDGETMVGGVEDS